VDEGASRDDYGAATRGYLLRGNGKLRNEQRYGRPWSDYRPASGVLSFDAGQTEQDVLRPDPRDTIEERMNGQSDPQRSDGGASLGTLKSAVSPFWTTTTAEARIQRRKRERSENGGGVTVM